MHWYAEKENTQSNEFVSERASESEGAGGGERERERRNREVRADRVSERGRLGIHIDKQTYTHVESVCNVQRGAETRPKIELGAGLTEP